MNKQKIFSKLLGTELELNTYQSNDMTVISAPMLKNIFDTSDMLRFYRSVPNLMYCDEHTAVYHCDIVTKDGETLVTGVGETHSENLPEKMLANRVKLAEMRAFSDAVVRFLQLPAVYYTDAQILVEKDLEETPAPVLPEVNTEEKVTPIAQAESTPAPAPEPAPEPAPAPVTETPASVIEYVYTTEDGEDGFVDDNTIVGFGCFRDKTCGYIINHKADETKEFLEALRNRTINPNSKKKQSVIARYLVTKTA